MMRLLLVIAALLSLDPGALAQIRNTYEVYAIEYARGMKRLVAGPGLIIPGHDPLVLSRFTPVAEGVVSSAKDPIA